MDLVDEVEGIGELYLRNRARTRSEQRLRGTAVCDNHRTKGLSLPIEPHYYLDETPPIQHIVWQKPPLHVDALNPS
jgi:hypothetical protein